MAESASNTERMEDTESAGIFHIVNVPTTHSIQPSTSNNNAMLDEVDPLSFSRSVGSVPDPKSFSMTALEEKIGYEFKDKTLLGRALTHSSANVTKCPSRDGENLEVLGDASLDLNPRYNQGQLSVLKSAITCNDTLAVIAVRSGLHLLLQHRLPEKQIEELRSFVDHQNKNQHLFSHEKELVIISSSEGDRAFDIDYPKVYADAFESLIGALRIDCEREDKVIRKVVLNLMGDVIAKFHTNIPVCPLQRVNQNKIRTEFKEEKNLPDGTVNVILEVKNFQSFHGSGQSLKSAKTAAARLAITTMPWSPTPNKAQGKKHKRTKSEPQGETSGETEKQHKRRKTEK
ncbi:hypothetical protein DAPPUDRAFT_118569 [Daphnia pulex]|uniref:RNase III domain-containing protein n=1 Tax=Daphnia pulex TaxID=6669 RepID=E9HW13_DAPPU|nr:hypothetical protein DAPPUDRAFT_118569 [Daphnia pulex]|eukprot:EFX64071.1 hypothetical protein DAPPUDRAFT_118569 [Daphnia pulex]